MVTWKTIQMKRKAKRIAFWMMVAAMMSVLACATYIGNLNIL